MVTDDDELDELLWSYRNVGRRRGGEWYEHVRLGWNLRLTEFQAAVLIEQMSRFPAQQAHRTENAAYLSARLSEIPGVVPLKVPDGVTAHSWYSYHWRWLGRAPRAACRRSTSRAALGPRGSRTSTATFRSTATPASATRSSAWAGSKPAPCPNAERAAERRGPHVLAADPDGHPRGPRRRGRGGRQGRRDALVNDDGADSDRPRRLRRDLDPAPRGDLDASRPRAVGRRQRVRGSGAGRRRALGRAVAHPARRPSRARRRRRRDDLHAVRPPPGPGAGRAAARRARRRREADRARRSPTPDAVVREGRERDLVVATISQRRFEPAVRALRAAVDAGALGRLSLIIAEGLYYRPQSYYDSAAWRGTRDLDGGVLMNQAIHTIDLLRWIGGPVASVAAHVATVGHGMEAEDTASVSLRFASGALGSIVADDLRHAGVPVELRVYGDRGHVRLVGEDAVEWDVPGSTPRRRATDEPAAPAGGGRDANLGDQRRRLPPPVRRLRRGGPRPAGRRSSPARTAAMPSRSSRPPTRRTGRTGRGARRRPAMKVGAAKVDITPPLGWPMEGFEARGRTAPAGSTIRSMRGRSSPRATTARPSRSSSRTCSRSTRASRTWSPTEVLERTGIPRERLQLAGTHTHSGPGPARAVRGGAGRSATRSPRPWSGPGRSRREAVAAVGIGHVEGIGGNRRPNGGPVDDRVTVTRFDAHGRHARSRPTSTTAAIRRRWARTTRCTPRTTRASCAASSTRPSAASRSSRPVRRAT